MVDRIRRSTDGVPYFDRAKSRVADVLSDAIGKTDDEVLTAWLALDAADLAAAREYDTALPPPAAAIQRALRDDPPHPLDSDVLELYLRLPRVELAYQRGVHGGSPIKVRSSFEAAFTDAMIAASQGIIWLAAVGCCCFLDELGTAVKRLDRPAADHLPTPLEKTLGRFTQLGERSRETLYALRCALAHDYSLVNIGRGKRASQLTQAFILEGAATTGPFMRWPSNPWTGDVHQIRATKVNLPRLIETTREVHDTVLRHYERGNLALGLSSAEARRRYIFTHPVSIEEWNAQQQADQRWRWGTT